MTKQYTSLEHSIRNIMEGRSNSFEHPKTLEQSILEGGHTLEEKVGPRPPNANTAPAPAPLTAAQAAELAASLTPFIGTGMSARDAYNAYQKGEYWKAAGLGALTAVSGASDILTLTGVGAPVATGVKAGIAAVKTGSKVADVATAAGTAAKVTGAASDAATAAGTAAKVTGAASDAANAADAASDAALIKRITSGKGKGDTPPASNAPENQGNLALKRDPEVFTPANTDGKINVPKPANDAGSNVVDLPRNNRPVPDATPSTKFNTLTPGQAPANRNASTFNSSVPNTTTVKPKAAANQTTAPSAVVTGTSTRVASNVADSAADARAADNAVDTATNVDKATDAATVLKNADNRRAVSNARAQSRRRFGRGAAARGLGKLRLSLPNIKTVFDSKSAAGQASGVGTYMHKAGAPLKVSEENEADTARTSIENVARLNSRRDKAVKQQEIQKKILDEKRSLADTVKRNVEEIRTKRKTESPIITNPELKRPEPEGINNVR
jgi:trimeric autotransporter adhesin